MDTTTEHVIDLDAMPFLPSVLTIFEHKKGGRLIWDATKVELYLSKEQREGKIIEGNRLREELKGKTALNANVLDYLLKNPHLIPKEWKGKAVFFWGSIYRDWADDLCVRYLYWDGDRSGWYNHWLDLDWHDGGPAAVLAS